jgi:ABC-type transport system involved in multi-copper enzyme maturation permease subunit
MATVLIICVIIVLIVLLLTILTTNKAYNYEHKIDPVNPMPEELEENNTEDNNKNQ